MSRRSKSCSKHCGKVVFFLLWLLLWLVSIALLWWNVQWHITSISEKIMAVVITIGLAILLVDVMEGMAMAIMAICLFGKPRKERIGDSSGITAILNYNLLAYCKKDIDDCYERMYEAFLGNLSENISAVLLSVTPDADLRRYELECRDKYRVFLKNTLLTEGNCYLKHETDNIEFVRLVNLWRKAEDRYGRRYLETNLAKFCQKISREFMCIHRVSKVLRKCGQYQDLMLLSDGYPNAFTYCDREFYGPYARPIGEPLFHDTDDVRNIYRRKFHYTFVLDGDTRVQPGVAHSLLNIAVKKPEKGIIQPSIKFEVTIWDTIYMHLEDLRAKLNKPMANVMPRVLGQCGFFGKALINNRIYIDSIIGHPNQVLEKVPVNALSHDTYEGAILKPYYVSNVSFIERPVYNYLAWNSRLRRWNLGDLILLTYFSFWFGRMIRSFQACAQKKDYFHVRVRTPVKFDFVSSYVAHSSIRSIFLKPYWCVFVIVYTAALGTKLYYRWVPIIVVLIIIVIFSKLPLLLHCDEAIMYIIPELFSSIVQFTAEIVVGVVRITRVFHALIVGRKKQIWVPQRFVEEEFNTVNVWKIWVYSWKHLWGYAVFGLVLIAVMIVLSVFAIIDPVIYILIIFDLATIAAIPLFCFITSLRICPCCHTKTKTDSDKVSLYTPSTLDSGYIDTKDSTILIPIEEDRPRRKITEHAEIWIDPPEPTMYREEVTVTRADQRRPTERIGSENIYEEILVPIDNSRHVETSYHVIDDDKIFDALSLKRSKKHRQVETYEEISDNWREHGKDNPVYDETSLEDEYIQVAESEPAFTKTVYRHVNETQRQSDTAYEDPVSYQGQAEVYEEIQDVEELRKEAELREALMTLDSAITGTKQQRRVKTDGASTRYVRTKQAVSERSPVNVIDSQISYQTERGPTLASGDRIDSDFSKYIMMQPRPEYVNTETIVNASPSRFMQERSDTHTHKQEDSRIRTTSAEIWSDKGTLSSLITDSTFLDEDESISYENMDVQTWLRSNQADAIHPQSTKTYENIPLQTQSITTRDYKTIGSIPEGKETSYFYENTRIPKTPEPVSYLARYGSRGNESETIEQTATTTYENVPRETTRIVSRDSGDYQTVLDYGTTPPIPGGKENPFTYGKIEDRVMSEGTLIDHKLYENLAQWHKAMEKTMLHEKHELSVERSRASNVMTSERLATSGAEKIPMPPPRQDSMVTYTTQRTFNILPKKSFDVRRDVIQEEPATTEYVQSNFTNVTIDSSSSDDEIATKKFSRKVTMDLQDQPSYTIVTERAASPEKLTPGKVSSSQSHQTEYMSDKVVKERAVSPQRNVSVERSVSPHRMVSVERVAIPQRETVCVQKMVVDERAVSPDRSVTVARSVSPQRLVSVKRVAPPHRETQYAEDMVVDERTVSPERFISLERASSPRRMVTVKRVVSPGDHGTDYEREKNVAVTGPSRSQNRQWDDEPHADRYETQNSETYEIIRRSVSPRNLQTDSDDSSEDVIVNTREVRVLQDPVRGTDRHMKRSHKIMKEMSASPQNREDFTKAAVLGVIDTRDINKNGVKSVLTGAAKVPEKALNVAKEKRKKTKDAMKNKLTSAKYVVKDTVGDVAGAFGEVNSGGGASNKLAQEEKDDWMLKYEKKKAKKALRADKDSQNH